MNFIKSKKNYITVNKKEKMHYKRIIVYSSNLYTYHSKSEVSGKKSTITTGYTPENIL